MVSPVASATTTGRSELRRIAVGPIHCVEHHDGAYTVWRGAGVSQRQLVHLDAHHDLYGGGWIDPKHPQQPTRINIANFIYAALAEKLEGGGSVRRCVGDRNVTATRQNFPRRSLTA